ncbi:PQQ-dependent sugar dehydrogenase [Halobacterium zhouii]|uniref:PQQ-dependent sugar dehydrogenase n=1 Tax=Halobacterium zhouii TaxID=2902624 RepID=UPI001E608E14|nr:PQQ-dependent sugar dehydrogenase [Halobacterium zhouii]
MPSYEQRTPDASASRGIGRRAFLGAALSGPFAVRTARAERQKTIELLGAADGWVGRSPASIESERNPTLTLESGTKYAIVWENSDGAPHNVTIEDGEGGVLVRSDIVSEQGATQTVEFTATDAMSTYYCEVHPSSMRGEVTTSGHNETSSGDEPLGEQRAIPMGQSVHLEQVAGGLTSPVGLEAAPGGSRLEVVLDQVGVAYRLEDGLADDPFLDVRDRLVAIGEGTWADYDERGLLALSFHPAFEQNGRFYLRYSAPPREGAPFQDYGHTAVVSEFEVTEDGLHGDPESERIVLEEPMPGPVHNGGGMGFGPDGYLYIGLSDGSSTNDVGPGHVEDWYEGNAGGNAQNVRANRLGGVLRIDVDGREGEKGYAIPDDNPLVGKPGHDEFFAWGLRNPWRLSFDSEGRLFVSDPGVQRFEEINIVEKGGNYGWNVREGTHCFDAENPGEPPAECPSSTPDDVRGGEPLLDPIIEYPHWDDFGNPVGTAAIGGYVSESGSVDALADKYVFGDFSRDYRRASGSLLVATPPDGDGLWSVEKLVVENEPDGRLGRFVFSLGRGGDGELYVLTNETGGPNGDTGAIHRIEPPGGLEETTATSASSSGTGRRTTAGGGPGGTGDESGGGSSIDRAAGAFLLSGVAGLAAYLAVRQGSNGE